jgi:phasin family protein
MHRTIGRIVRIVPNVWMRRRETMTSKTGKPAAALDTIAADAQEKMSANFEKAAKSFEEVAAFNQQTIDAIVQSQGVAAKAAEEINAEFVAYSKKALDDGMAFAKDLATTQTLAEFVEKQTGYAKASFDSLMAESTKLNEMMMAAMKDATAPVSARVAAAFDMVKATAA